MGCGVCPAVHIATWKEPCSPSQMRARADCHSSDPAEDSSMWSSNMRATCSGGVMRSTRRLSLCATRRHFATAVSAGGKIGSRAFSAGFKNRRRLRRHTGTRGLPLQLRAESVVCRCPDIRSVTRDGARRRGGSASRGAAWASVLCGRTVSTGTCRAQTSHAASGQRIYPRVRVRIGATFAIHDLQF